MTLIIESLFELCWCGDRIGASRDNAITMAREVLVKAFESMDLRREAYCQIIKQLTNNPNPDSHVKAWELMLLMLDNIPPNRDLENYLGKCKFKITQVLF